MQGLKNIISFCIGEDIGIPAMLVRSKRMAVGQNFTIVRLFDRDTPMADGVTLHKRLKLSMITSPG
jgi:hypothetical protein